MIELKEDPLREEVRYLGQLLGGVIEAQEGAEFLDFEEEVRHLSKRRRREGVPVETLRKMIEGCDTPALFALTRAFSIFFDLANLAEDRHRIRVLREREKSTEPAPRKESIRAALKFLREQGMGPEQLLEILEFSFIEPVFTAHPTEAKRRTVRSKLRRIRELMKVLASAW